MVGLNSLIVSSEMNVVSDCVSRGALISTSFSGFSLIDMYTGSTIVYTFP